MLSSSHAHNNNFALTNDINDLEMMNGIYASKKKTAKRATPTAVSGQKRSRKRRSLRSAESVKRK